MELGAGVLWQTGLLVAFVCIWATVCCGRRCVLTGILSRRSFRGTTAFYFARFWNWRVKGGVKAAGVADLGCDGEGQR